MIYRISLMIMLLFTLNACETTQSVYDKQKAQAAEAEPPPPPRVLPQRTEEPVQVITLKGTPAQAAACLKTTILGTFKIPEDFIETESFPDGTQNVSLINPATQTAGVSIDLYPQAENSEAKMYANGTVVSKAWPKILHQCD